MKKILILLIVVIVLGAGWYLGSPLFIDRTVQEEIKDVAMIREGTFRDADKFHQASGVAILGQRGEDTVVTLRDFAVTNGPDLRVILVENATPTKDTLGDYLDLGKLKGNIGDQAYTVPAGVDAGRFNSVVIYCDPFHVVFGAAELR